MQRILAAGARGTIPRPPPWSGPRMSASLAGPAQPCSELSGRRRCFALPTAAGRERRGCKMADFGRIRDLVGKVAPLRRIDDARTRGTNYDVGVNPVRVNGGQIGFGGICALLF